MAQKLDLSELFGGGVKQDDRIFTKHMVNIHEFYLTGEMESAENYIQWFDTIRHASQNDAIKIYINSPGGDLFTAIQFMNALRETEAQVIIVVEGLCVSAATMIFMQGDSFEIADHATMMIHNYSGGMFGKSHEIHSQSDYEKLWAKKLITDVYKDFLDKAEIDKVINGADIWLNADEVIARLKKIDLLRKKKDKNTK